MSEKLTSSGEREAKLEAQEIREQKEAIGERLQENAEKERGKENSQEAVEAKSAAEREAISGKEAPAGEGEKKSKKQPVHRSHKQMTYRATMKRVEGKLPAYQRSFSRIINNDTIDKVSNISSKTVARPSALLGGGVVASAALLIVTIYAGRYGWEVSGSEFVVFVALGWAAGLLIEAVYRLMRRYL